MSDELNEDLLRSVTAYELSDLSRTMDMLSEARNDFTSNTELSIHGQLDIVTSTGEAVGQLFFESEGILFVGAKG